jgi:hypothetical protein
MLIDDRLFHVRAREALGASHNGTIIFHAGNVLVAFTWPVDHELTDDIVQFDIDIRIGNFGGYDFVDFLSNTTNHWNKKL